MGEAIHYSMMYPYGFNIIVQTSQQQADAFWDYKQ